jgi:hypothetical protein
LRIVKHRIYGEWDGKTVQFKFKNSGDCQILWKAHSLGVGDDIKFIRENNANGKYEIVNQKLILKYGQNLEDRWIAEICQLYKKNLVLLDLNGSNIGEKEFYNLERSYEPLQGENKWYHNFIGIPKDQLSDVLFDYAGVIFAISLFAAICMMPLIALIYGIIMFIVYLFE